MTWWQLWMSLFAPKPKPKPNPNMIVRQARTMTWDSLTRYYELDVCSKNFSSLGGAGAPLIVVCHGGGSNPGAVRTESRFNELQEMNGEFIVAYPRGTTNSFGSGYYWNDGRNFHDGTPQTADDVGFIVAMVAEIATLYSIDLTHVYIAGYSNGAQMTHRLMHEADTTFAAAGTISGHRYPDAFLGAMPRAFPFIQFSGTSDLFGKYLGGYAILDPVFEPYNFPSVPDARDAWVVSNGCDTTPVVTTLNLATEVRFPAGSGKPHTVWVLDGAGHNWPGGNTEAVAALGSTNTDIWAAQEMWRFFQQHTLP